MFTYFIKYEIQLLLLPENSKITQQTNIWLQRAHWVICDNCNYPTPLVIRGKHSSPARAGSTSQEKRLLPRCRPQSALKLEAGTSRSASRGGAGEHHTPGSHIITTSQEMPEEHKREQRVRSRCMTHACAFCSLCSLIPRDRRERA